MTACSRGPSGSNIPSGSRNSIGYRYSLCYLYSIWKHYSIGYRCSIGKHLRLPCALHYCHRYHSLAYSVSVDRVIERVITFLQQVAQRC